MTKMDERWCEAEPAVKWRFQKLVFPAGLDFDGESFGTISTNKIIGALHECKAPSDILASPRGFEPLSPA